VTLLIVSFFTTYLGLGVANVIIVSLRQATTPQPMMSRMTACFRTLLYGGGALGALTAGLLAGAIGTKQALVAAAVASAAVVVALLLSPVTRLRELPDVVTAPGEGRRGQAVTSGTTVTGPTVPSVDGPAPAPAPLRALLLENIHPDAAARLAEAGCEIQARAGVLSEDELIEAVRGVSLLGIRSRTHVTERVLAAAPHLVAVGAFCVGVNQIDLAAAARRGIAVFNAPFSNTRSVVELVLAEIIALARRLPEKNAGMHAGRWDKSASGSHEVRGRRLGIVGYGNIGAQLSVLAESLGMSVYFYDIADKQALGNARRCGSLDELLDSVDTVTVHVDGRPGNRGLFGEAEFARMRPRSLFLNLSRGFVVDHQALRRSIESDHLAGAAVDVFPDEPDGKGEEFVSGLRGLPNVILTPHVGGSTEEAQQDIGEFVAGKLRDYVRAGTTSLSVNLPGIALPAAPGTHQLVHIHQNVPGVLASVNRLLADHGVNVQGQMLGTRNDIGYAITNVATEYSAEVLAKLRAMDVTIRLRTIPITTEILHESAPSVRVSA
jgi:D-3-phosphoglycerate dehydrogenase